MQSVKIGVVRSHAGSGDAFQVYGNSGTGSIDWVHPLTPRRQLLWPDSAGACGHLAGKHLCSAHLDGIGRDGHLEGAHLLDEHLFPAACVSYEAGPYVFGRVRHAVVTEDARGNPSPHGAVFHEIVVNSEPAPARELAVVDYDVQSGRLTLTFQPSERLSG